MLRLGTAVAVLMLAAPALAQEAGQLRDLCAERPGLGIPACIVDHGHVQIEVGLIDWTLDRDGGVRTDTLVAGDALLRVGVSDSTELRLGWMALGDVRERDAASATSDRMTGTGDVTLGLKQNLFHPDGHGLAIALLPFATIPTGGAAIGGGAWAAGFAIPVTYELDDRFSLELTPEIDALADEDRHGRHLAYSAVAGVIAKLGEAASVTAEFQAVRDRDPGGHETQRLAALSLAWQPGRNTQLDIGTVAGLDHKAPGIELIAGVTHRF